MVLMRYIKVFTLIELLIVIAIIAVLGSATVLVLNPVELMKQGRDSQRMTDLRTVKESVEHFIISNTQPTLGTNQILYISIPDNNVDCSGVTGLPALQAGWAYRCVSSANLRKVDGTGWIPLDFRTVSGGSTVASLPIDPQNDANNFYTYSTLNGNFITYSGILESTKYSQSSAPLDGGSYPNKFEIGTNLAVAEGVDNILTPQANRLLQSGHSWSCYKGVLPYHVCDAGIIQTLVTNGYSIGGNSLRYEISQTARGAVFWNAVPYSGNQYYHYQLYIKALSGSGGKSVFLERYTSNSTYGVLDTTKTCVLSENNWTLCDVVWQGRTGDDSTQIYVFPNNLPLSFDMAFPSVKKKTTP